MLRSAPRKIFATLIAGSLAIASMTATPHAPIPMMWPR